MKKIPDNHLTLWIDKTLQEQAEQNKENDNKQNVTARSTTTDGKLTSRSKNFLFELPFAERFKDKLFAFNKAGKMCKVDESQSPSLKASLLLTKCRQNKIQSARSIFRTKKLSSNMKVADESSRVSLQSKDTQRETKSLDASKVSTVFMKESKHRYALDCSEIKQEEIQETIIKKTVDLRKIYTPLEPRRGQSNTRRAIHFQSEGMIEQSLVLDKQVKPFFKMRKAEATKQLQHTLQDPTTIKLPSLTGRPTESLLSKRLMINTQKRQPSKTQKKEELLPRLKLNNQRKIFLGDEERMVTIR